MATFSHVGVRAQYCTDDARFSHVPLFTDQQIAYDTTIVYGNAVNYKGQYQDLRLNICYPSIKADTMRRCPLIILMHGGGFLVGNRNDMNSLCVEFAKRGFVAATVGYRLGWDSKTGGCDGDTISNIRAMYRGYQDAHAALRYLVANSGKYKIDTAWIFSGGESAGGVNSLNLAFTSQTEMNTRYPFLQAELGDINSSGNKLTSNFSLKAVFNNWGSIVDTSFITAGDALPMVAFHGDADKCLPIDYGAFNSCPGFVHLFGSAAIYRRLQTLGVCTQLSIRKDGGHGVYDNTSDQDQYRVNKASCFFKSLFCNTCYSEYTHDSIAYSCQSIGTSVDNNNNEHGLSVVTLNQRPGYFSIHVGDNNARLFHITVFTIQGKFAWGMKEEATCGYINIDFSTQPRGAYFVQIYDGEQQSTKMVVTQ